VIIGVGSTMRRDDGLGPAALAQLGQVEEVRRGEVELVSLDGEPTRLIDAWSGRRRAVIIDAVCADSPPGSIHRLVLGRHRLPPGTRGASSHAAGLAEAVELGAALDRLPDELVVLGMEPGDVSAGERLSPAVAEAMGRLVSMAQAEACR
jgi:hydrogenase maturation protease